MADLAGLIVTDSEHELTQEQAVERFSEALAGQLRAIYAVETDFASGPRSGRGRLLVVLEQLSCEVLEPVVTLVTRCQASAIKVRVDTVDNLLRGADTYPALALELKDHRRLLTGQDVLADLTVDLGHLRLHVEHGLRGILRDLTANYLDRDIKGWQVPELRRMARKLVYLLEGMLLCGNVPPPAPATANAILDAVRTRLVPDARPDVWNVLSGFARGELPPGPDAAKRVYTALFDALPRIIAVVDRMPGH